MKMLAGNTFSIRGSRLETMQFIILLGETLGVSPVQYPRMNL